VTKKILLTICYTSEKGGTEGKITRSAFVTPENSLVEQ
jgi:hypothetical protein